jgi:hypothetical protein
VEPSPTTIEALPEELIHEILLLADLDQGCRVTNDIPDPSLLNIQRLKPAAKVCSQLSTCWRRRVHDAPRCWFIPLVVGAGPEPLSIPSDALSSSQGCDLDLWIYWEEILALEEAILSVLTPHAKQIRFLYMHCRGINQSTATNALRIIAALAPSRLTQLQVEGLSDSVLEGIDGQPTPTIISNLKISDGCVSGFLTASRIQAVNLDISRSALSSFTPLIESLAATRKLCLAFPSLAERNDPLVRQAETRACPQLRAIRLEGTAGDIKQVLRALDTRSVSRLSIYLSGSRTTGTMSQPERNDVPTLASLTEVTICFERGLYHKTWFWEIVAILPWAWIKKFTFESTEYYFPSDRVAPAWFIPLSAECLTHLQYETRSPIDAFSFMLALSYPALTDLCVELTWLSNGSSDEYPEETVYCPQLSRLAIIGNDLKATISDLEDILGFIGHIRATSLRQLDLTWLVFRANESVWKKAWNNLRFSLVGLEELGIILPGKHTKLKHCFKHCENLKVLKLVIDAYAPVTDALLLLANPESNYLPKLQTLQIHFFGAEEEQTLLEITSHLQQLLSSRKSLGIPIAELGILFSPEQGNVDNISCLSSEVKLVLGDVCEGIFPPRKPINSLQMWDSW